ncbi:hypothetical protein GCM10023069_41060 [Shinella granuli]|jgi:hypothetical protein
MGKLPRTTQTYRLQHPIAVDGGSVEVVRLTRPDDAALNAMVALNLPEVLVAKHCRLILAIVSDIPGEAIGRLHPRDFRAVSSIAIGLIERPPGATVQ